MLLSGRAPHRYAQRARQARTLLDDPESEYLHISERRLDEIAPYRMVPVVAVDPPVALIGVKLSVDDEALRRRSQRCARHRADLPTAASSLLYPLSLSACAQGIVIVDAKDMLPNATHF